MWKSHEDNCGNQLLHKTRNVAISALFLMTVPFNLVLLCSFNSLPIMIFISNYELLWRRQWHPTPILLPGKSHGQRSLVGYSPWGRKESDTTERLPFRVQVILYGTLCTSWTWVGPFLSFPHYRSFQLWYLQIFSQALSLLLKPLCWYV